MNGMGGRCWLLRGSEGARSHQAPARLRRRHHKVDPSGRPQPLVDMTLSRKEEVQLTEAEKREFDNITYVPLPPSARESCPVGCGPGRRGAGREAPRDAEAGHWHGACLRAQV